MTTKFLQASTQKSVENASPTRQALPGEMRTTQISCPIEPFDQHAPQASAWIIDLVKQPIDHFFTPIC